MGRCLFCEIIAKKVPAAFVYEDDAVIAFKDISPQAPTHILIIPKKHIASLAVAGEDETPLLGKMQNVAAKLGRELGLGQGFRVVTNSGRMAGQTVDHLHYHLLGGRQMQWPPG